MRALLLWPFRITSDATLEKLAAARLEMLRLLNSAVIAVAVNRPASARRSEAAMRPPCGSCRGSEPSVKRHLTRCLPCYSPVSFENVERWMTELKKDAPDVVRPERQILLSSPSREGTNDHLIRRTSVTLKTQPTSHRLRR